jgi:hypothetical protein
MGGWDHNGSWGDWLGECRLDPAGSGQGPVAGCREYGDEPSGSGATELDTGCTGTPNCQGSCATEGQSCTYCLPRRLILALCDYDKSLFSHTLNLVLELTVTVLSLIFKNTSHQSALQGCGTQGSIVYAGPSLRFVQGGPFPCRPTSCGYACGQRSALCRGCARVAVRDGKLSQRE